MSQVIQPAYLLREYFQGEKEIIKENDNLRFSDNIVLSLKTPTALIKTSTNSTYTLGCLWFFLKYKNETVSSYMSQCFKEKIDNVFTMDKPQLIDFFVNGIDNVAILDKDKLKETEINLNESINKDSNDEKKDENNNILALNEDPNKKIMEYLLIKEKNNINRNSMIRIPSLRFDYLLQIVRRTFIKAQVNEKILPVKINKNVKSTFFEELFSEDGKKYKILVYF